MICPKCKKGEIKVTKILTTTYELETDVNGCIIEGSEKYNSTEFEGFNGTCSNSDCEENFEVNDDGIVIIK